MICNTNELITIINEFSKNSDEDKLKLFNFLLNVFDKNKNLNKVQEIIGIYYMKFKKNNRRRSICTCFFR